MLAVADADVTDPEAVDAAFAEVDDAPGPLEVLVGEHRHHRGHPAAADPRRRPRVIVVDANLPPGSFRLAEQTAKGMLPGFAQRIIYISSGVRELGSSKAGWLHHQQGRPPHRHGQFHRPRARQSLDHRQHGAAPASSRTEWPRSSPRRKEDQFQARIPLRPHYATTEEVTAAWSGSSPTTRAAYVTRAVIPVDSGLGIGH